MAPGLDLKERRSASNNSKTEVYTIEDIAAAAGSVENFLSLQIGDESSVSVFRENGEQNGKPTYLFVGEGDGSGATIVWATEDEDGPITPQWQVANGDTTVAFFTEADTDLPETGEWDTDDVPATLTIFHYRGTLQEILEALASKPSGDGGGSDYTETIVTITPTETTYSDGRPLVASGILAMGTTPIELLPAAGVGMYYEYYGIAEYTAGNVSYDFANINGSPAIGQGNYAAVALAYQAFSTYDVVMYFSSQGTPTVQPLVAPFPTTFSLVSSGFVELNRTVVLRTLNSANPIDGDGTLRVKIYHKTITFGA
jgi:hypothetical protein